MNLFTYDIFFFEMIALSGFFNGRKLFPDSDPLMTSRFWGLYLKYTLRFLGLIFRDSLRFWGPFLSPKCQVPTSLKCDLAPPPPGRPQKPLSVGLV